MNKEKTATDKLPSYQQPLVIGLDTLATGKGLCDVGASNATPGCSEGGAAANACSGGDANTAASCGNGAAANNSSCGGGAANAVPSGCATGEGVVA